MDARLANEPCEACRPGSPRVTGADLAALLVAVPAWERIERDGVDRLRRPFPFPDFTAALAFVARVGALAEAEDHHPAISLRWGRAAVTVTVTWWTHAIGGLHRNDFRMAARCDAIARYMAPAGDESPAD